ncbi:MAG: DegT/DnrJ/EryC1/StrS family aminotransferase [Gammaproteobacteria bacterium]|nr:DegT/DnrJ/EryC1/StrS family aminotransferase [Gammaproteobacteria bacterium]MCH9717059.1 DegT/DnrJ/EryC1/StrS family aminotransferase [Gammaproteobacteria bacterium]MCH9763221.1 DegT/DnrJ/EryC1/StrS family aminotransferase [Gammaproteobacteria bacterium]
MSLHVPFVDLSRRYRSLKSEIMPDIEAVLDSGQYILGDVVERFEKNMAAYLGCRYVLSVANGTDALILGLKALGITTDDEVIVPANSFIASAGAVAMVGAKPVFCDVGDDFNINPELITALITSKTKAIMPVHLTGRPADMQAIWDIAKQHKLFIIEDAAQAIGAKYQNKMTGNLGDFGCFSLHPLKNLSIYGDGGLISLNDESHYQYLKRLRNHGLQDRDTCLHWGLNSRLDAIQAVAANAGLQHLEQWTERHRSIATRYQQGLHDFVGVPEEGEGWYSVYHNFVITTDKRDALQRDLAVLGVETKIHYPIPLHLQPAAKSLGYQLGDFPKTEYFAAHMLSLPIYPELTDVEVDYVINCVQQCIQEK